LYLLSDVTYIVLFRIIGYRKKVVLTNLRNSFPEKSEQEIRMIRKNFYHYFCDLVLETLKTLTISPAAVKRHILFKDISVLERFKAENKSVILVMGHFGNWELGGPIFSLQKQHQLYVIYHPLQDKRFDGLVYRIRSRFGTKLYAMNDTLRGMISNKNTLTATAFIADQTPLPANAYWTTFLHQDTPIFTGYDKIARKLNYPVLYISIDRVRRGLYNLTCEVLVENPSATEENEIADLFTKRLEKDILAKPEIWLWSHKRWKHSRKSKEEK